MPPFTFHLIPNVSIVLLYKFHSFWKMKSAADCNSGWVFYVVVSLTFFWKVMSVYLTVSLFFWKFQIVMFGYRFDGQDFLEKTRGKSIMFVGDSLSRNQWQSLTCLLHSAVPNSNYTLARVGDVSIFTLTVWFSNLHHGNTYVFTLFLS